MDRTIQAGDFGHIEEEIFNRGNADFGEHLLTV
jgi:hypothetical protein